jgi:hypothetical protein
VKGGALSPTANSRAKSEAMCLPFVVFERSMSQLPLASGGRKRFGGQLGMRDQRHTRGAR